MKKLLVKADIGRNDDAMDARPAFGSSANVVFINVY